MDEVDGRVEIRYLDPADFGATMIRSGEMAVCFDPMRLRARLAERDESYAAFLADPLFADEAAAQMPGLAEWHAYRGLPPEAQEPRGLTPGHFAMAYREVLHPAGILDRPRGEWNGGSGG